MTNIYVAERALDLSPMIEALKFQPSDFELERGWLVHVPSRHRYRFDRRGNLSIDAHCGCAVLEIRRDHEGELKTAVDRWRTDYWRYVETNREFSSHFASVGRLRRFARDLRMAFRRLLRTSPGEAPEPTPALTPAE